MPLLDTKHLFASLFNPVFIQICLYYNSYSSNILQLCLRLKFKRDEVIMILDFESTFKKFLELLFKKFIRS